MENCNEIVKDDGIQMFCCKDATYFMEKGVFLSQVPGRATECPVLEVENLVVKGSSQQCDLWFGLFIGLAVCNVCVLGIVLYKKVKKCWDQLKAPKE